MLSPLDKPAVEAPSHSLDANPRVIAKDNVYSIHALTHGDVQVYRCTAAPQLRNWSMIGEGEAISDGGKPDRLFLKQFVDRSGKFLPRNFDREIRAHLLANRLFGDGIIVPQLRVADPVNLVLGYEYVAVTPFDELLRTDPTRFARQFPAVLPKLAQLLTALIDGSAMIPEKRRKKVNLSGPESLVFRGLDVRNMGLVRSTENDRKYDLCIFDFERAYDGYVAEASAKLFVSVGMLNWGRPVSRFVRGPDLTLLDQAFSYLQPFCRPDAIRQRLNNEFAQRQRVVKAVNGLESAAKKLGIQFLGRRYFDSLKEYSAALQFSET